jgi:hypothetical protein
MYVIQERYWFFGKRWRNTYNENGEECTYTYKESAKDMYNELILKQTKPQIIESIVETTDEKLLRLVEKIGIK